MSSAPTWAHIPSGPQSPSPPPSSALPASSTPPTKRRKKDPNATSPAKRGRKAKVVVGTHLTFSGLPASMRQAEGSTSAASGSGSTERPAGDVEMVEINPSNQSDVGSGSSEDDIVDPPQPSVYTPSQPPPKPTNISPSDPRNAYMYTPNPPVRPSNGVSLSPHLGHPSSPNFSRLSPSAFQTPVPGTSLFRVNTPGTFAGSGGGRMLQEKGTDGGSGFTGKKGHGAGGVKRDVMGVHVLKKEDGDMCTRDDIQHDLLNYIFTSPIQAFTPPRLATSPLPLPTLPTKLTFADLYAYTLAASPKVTKGLKEALLDLAPGALPGKSKAGQGKGRRKKKAADEGGDPDAEGGDGKAEGEGDEEIENYEGLRMGYMKMCLLVNVGRINTTFAFYPEMRTILRAYHSVPSLQQSIATRKSMQDAPRMKNGLKACKLEDETEKQPAYFHDLGKLLESGKTPPTTVCNMLFAITSTPELVNERHFAPYQGIVEVLSLFTRLNVPSQQRAQVFLWLMFRYLESATAPNPFAGPDGAMPQMTILSADDYNQLGENVDTPEEIAWGEEMKVGRVEFLKSLANGTAVTGKVFAGASGDGKGDSAKKDSSNTAGSVDGSQGDQKLTPGKSDGPLPMSLARVKDAQAIISRKLKGKTDDNGNALALPPASSYKRKRRPDSPGGSNTRSSPGSEQNSWQGEPDADRTSRPPLQSRNSGYSGYKFGTYRSPYAGIDTTGIDEERVEQLKRRVEEELDLSPSRSPPVSWEAFRPTLPAFVLPPELAAILPEENSPLPGSASPAIGRSATSEDRVMDTELNGDASFKRTPVEMMARKQSISSSADADASPSMSSTKLPHEEGGGPMGPPAGRRGQSIMSLLN